MKFGDREIAREMKFPDRETLEIGIVLFTLLAMQFLPREKSPGFYRDALQPNIFIKALNVMQMDPNWVYCF